MLVQIADLLENVRVALDGLLANKLRSALTMLGVIIGVAAVIALVSVGSGAQASITDQISSMGTNLLIVVPQSMGRVQGGGSGSPSWLTMEDVEAISDPRNVPDARLVVPQYGVSGQIIYGDTNFNVSGIGTTPDYLTMFDLAVRTGRFIGEGDDGDKVVVLGANVAQELFGDFDPVGTKIKLTRVDAARKVSVRIIGVLDDQGGSMFADVDDSIIVPLETAQTKLSRARNVFGDLTVSRINVQAASESAVGPAVDQITDVLREEHDLASLDDDDFTVINQADMLDAATQVTDTFTVFLGAVAGISLLVGGIGIMNIMLVSVTERTREIGLRKAIGARRSDILLQFLMEAVILSLLGGSIGIGVGIGLAQLANLTGLLTSVVTADSIFLAVGFSIAVGLFFGIYPANQAAKLNPIEALRYE